jgi:vacuolar protein sorting-associated protein 26
MNWLGFGGTPLDIDIALSNQDQLRQVLGKNESGEVEPLFLLTQGDNVCGTVVVKYKGKKVEHLGIKIELLGQIGE